MYSPQEFAGWLNRASGLGFQVIAAPQLRQELVTKYHHESLATMQERWNSDMLRLATVSPTGTTVAEPANPSEITNTTPPSASSQPTLPVEPTDPGVPVAASNTAQAAAETPLSVAASVALEVAAPKGRVERKMLANMMTMNSNPVVVSANETTAVPAEVAARVARPKEIVERKSISLLTMVYLPPLETTDEVVWNQLATLYTDDVRFDGTSQLVMVSENPAAIDASRVARSKIDIEGPILAKMFDRLKSSIAMDTVRNEYQLHRQIHEWFLNGETGTDLATLNERVYAELFLTPSSDPWLGLVERDVYTGLNNAGVRNQ